MCHISKHPRGGGSRPQALIRKVLHLWLQVFCKLGPEEPGWGGPVAASGIRACVEGSAFQQGLLWGCMGPRGALHSAVRQPGCIRPGVLLWAIAPAGALTTPCWTVRDKRGLRHLVPLQLPEARIYCACLSPRTTTNASRQRDADQGVKSARLW